MLVLGGGGGGEDCVVKCSYNKFQVGIQWRWEHFKADYLYTLLTLSLSLLMMLNKEIPNSFFG
jgi:hypothetical protein